MALVYIFGDESGNLDFSSQPGASRYFTITTVTTHNCSIGAELLELKRTLHWEGHAVGDYFHATEDKQAVRDRVFDVLREHDLRVDATVYEKAKTQPHLAGDEMRFYKLAWFLHLKVLIASAVTVQDELFLIAASLGTRAKRVAAHSALKDVMAQVAHSDQRCEVAFWPAATDPCLQVADYCCWAIQRKWESGDSRSHVLIADKIKTEYDMFALGPTRYY